MVGRLTRGQLEVLWLTANGHSASDIGIELGICEKTVANHKKDIAKRLDSKNTIHSVHLAHVHNLFAGRVLRLTNQSQLQRALNLAEQAVDTLKDLKENIE